MTDLDRVFARQLQLQVDAFGVGHPGGLPLEERVEYIRWNALALTREVFEALDETSWKPWASDTFVNEDALLTEMVDVLHFFVNICLAADVTADELVERYLAKADVNEKRQASTYEHGTMKCPTCGRGLDEPGETDA